MNYDGIREIGRLEPTLRRGMIVAASVGDVTRFDVDVLAVNARSVNRRMVARAHRGGREVQVWTVNEPARMLTMIHLGVDNILTSSPDVLAELLRERDG